MKSFIIVLFFGGTAAAQTPKHSVPPAPQWSITVQLDHISFPSFRKFRPLHGADREFFKSWSVTAGKVLSYPSDARGLFCSGYMGVIRNGKLQKGLQFGLQSGYTTETQHTPSPLFQAGVAAGGLLLFQRSFDLTSMPKKVVPSYRLQWTGGIFLNAGASFHDRRYSSYAVQYKLWLQGPYIHKHAAALPHQSVGFTASK